MAHIRISYSRKDKKYAERIASALSQSEVGIWLDWYEIPPVETWEEESFRGVINADALLFLISPDSVKSEACNKELEYAAANHKLIIPVLVRDTDNVPLIVSGYNWIYCRESDNFEHAIRLLENVLNTDYEWINFHTKLLVKAIEWDAKKKDKSLLLRGKELQEAEQKLNSVMNQVDPQPTIIQREFISASRRQEEMSRRNVTIGLVSGLIWIIALVFYSFYLQEQVARLEQTTNSKPNLTMTYVLGSLIIAGLFAIALMMYNLNRRAIKSKADDFELSADNKYIDTNKMLKVFLCHSSSDKLIVRQLYDRLKLEKGIDPWLDVEKLLPGVDWDLEIRTAVKDSHVVLVCLSKQSISKEGYIQKEIRQALDVADEKPEGMIFIIPLRLEDCEVPSRLKQWQWLNFYENDSYNKLLTSLRKRANDLMTKNTGLK